MATEVCSLVPKVRRRKGLTIQEHDSQLYQAIKEAVSDRKTAWEMWAYTKTRDFRDKYRNTLEFDELGEVTFPSLIKALDLESIYDNQKKINEVSRDYGFDKKVFSSAGEVVENLNRFNTREKRFIAVSRKGSDGYRIQVLPRIGSNIQAAFEQSYNHALTLEIIDFLKSLGFSVDFVTNPKFDGIFNPEEATLRDGLVNIISIAEGKRGEEALPEEFAHLLIEGLINHPVVQRLLQSLDMNALREVLGSQYEQYAREYDNDLLRLKKEAAGKLLAQHIKKEGTIETSRDHRFLLAKIWRAVKEFFSRITRKHVDKLEHDVYERVSQLYNLVASREAVPFIDKHSIISADKMYALKEGLDSLEKIARSGKAIVAKMSSIQEQNGLKGESRNTLERLKKIKTAIDNDDTANYVKAIYGFLSDAEKQIEHIEAEKKIAQDYIDSGNVSEIWQINEIAKVVRETDSFILGYQNMVSDLAAFDAVAQNPEDLAQLGISKDVAEIIAKEAKKHNDAINTLIKWKATTERNIVLWAVRTVYKDDVVRGIGSERNRIMALEQILEHADRDINFIDRWLSALSDADDPLLVMFDSIVKNQQYERDVELMELNAEIAAADEALRKAGYSSDFMLEPGEDGVPTGRIRSIYDWDAYDRKYKARLKVIRELQEKYGHSEQYVAERMREWERGVEKTKGNKPRRIRRYIDPDIDRRYQETGEKPKEHAAFEWVPNPEVYDGKAKAFEGLSDAQITYYNKMMDIKRRMMLKIPRRGQRLYNAIYISKDFIEGVIGNTTGNPISATAEQWKKMFVRRPDDIGFGVMDNEQKADDFKKTIKDILSGETDREKAANKIVSALSDALDRDVLAAVSPRKISAIIVRYDRRIRSGEITPDKALEKEVEDIIEYINSENFYIVQTDFEGHTIQKLPVYYTRPLKDMRNISTDFSGCIAAYSAMAINYEKMNEAVDILEIGRAFVKQRKVQLNEGNKPIMSRFKALNDVYSTLVTIAGSNSNIAGRMDDWMDSVVYEKRKNNEGTIKVLGANIDVAKSLDTIKDYTGLLGLGFNLFSTISNVAVGKLQQWIEGYAGEWFTLKDYAKANIQYTELLPGCLAEIASPVKHNKLSLLIQMFDPMGDYFENLRDPNYNKSAVARILGNNMLAFIGMNAGEHILHCTTMLAILNNTKLYRTDPSTGEKTGETVSLYDALKVETKDGVSKLVLQDNLAYEKDIIDNTGTAKTNKNYGKPKRDEKGKKVTELVPLRSPSSATSVIHGEYKPDEKVDISTNKMYRNWLDYMFRRKRIIRKVNDSLNGAFGVNDKGAFHKKAVGRLIMQYRQWMPAHYMRRFARSHYDDDLQQFREGYYVTSYKVLSQIADEVIHSKFEYLKLKETLSDHEKANLRRAMAEVYEFAFFMTFIRISGRVKDRDRSWLEKMYLYQIRRMYLEVGASMPVNGGFFSNIFKLLQSPAASIDTFEKVSKIVQFWNLADEIQRGRYKGWSEWERDAFKLIPPLDQVMKAYNFDYSMFSMYEDD